MQAPVDGRQPINLAVAFAAEPVNVPPTRSGLPVHRGRWPGPTTNREGGRVVDRSEGITRAELDDGVRAEILAGMSRFRGVECPNATISLISEGW